MGDPSARELVFPNLKFPLNLPRCNDYTGLINLERSAFDGGSQSDVYKGVLNGTWVAIKVMRVVSSQTEEDALRRQTREVEIYKRLQFIRHENILTFHGITKDFSNIGAMVMPYMENRNVTYYLNYHPNANIGRLVRGFVRGLRHLHSWDIVHGDLKASNILISSEGIPMIADYGRAYLDAATSCTNSTNNSAWTAPEFFSIKEFDLKNVLTKSADSWSMAVTILEIYCGKKNLWGGKGFHSQLRAMGKRLNPSLGKKENYPSVPEKLWPLLITCWNYEPALRLNVENFDQRLHTVFPD